MRIKDIIDAVEYSSGLGKQVVLEKHKDNELLQRVFWYAMHPWNTYKIKQIDAVVADPRAELTEQEELDLLTQLFETLDKLTMGRQNCHAYLPVVNKAISLAGSSALLFSRIVRKDLNIGAGVTTINKVWPGLIPEFKVALANDYEKAKRVAFPTHGEIKFNGKRCHAFVYLDEVELKSRKGISFEGYDHVRAALLQTFGARVELHGPLFLDGELMFGRYGDRKAQEAEAQYIIYDAMPLSEFESRKSTMTQRQRSGFLSNYAVAFPLSISKVTILHNKAALEDYYRAAVLEGHEGIMVKDPSATYQFKRSNAWLKYKPTYDVDLPIVDVFEGRDDTRLEGDLGGIIVDYNGVHVRVGSGIDDAFRNEWRGRWHELIGQTAEIEYKVITPYGSLENPVFVRLRDDK